MPFEPLLLTSTLTLGATEATTMVAPDAPAPITALVTALATAPDTESSWPALEDAAPLTVNLQTDSVSSGTAITPLETSLAPGDNPWLPYGTKGTRRWRWFASGGTDFSPENSIMWFTGIGVTQFVAEGLALHWELAGFGANQEGPDAYGGGFSLMFHWHFHRAETWSLVAEGGAGMLFTNEDIPEQASQVNFTPQAGLGFTRELDEGKRLHVGVRWFHVSNARTKKVNPGRDHFILYGGVSMPF